MPYWSIFCMYCGGYIADALLECLPATKRASAAFQVLFTYAEHAPANETVP